MTQSNDVLEWAARWRQGDEAAAAHLYARYAQALVRLADAQLCAKIAVRENGEDVVQSVFRTFFRRLGEGRLQFNSPGGLWKLLVQITIRKARAKARAHSQQMRDVEVEQGGDPEAVLIQALSREPSPEETATFVEQLERLLERLPEAHQHVLVRSLLEGQSVQEISESLNLTQWSVQRILKLFRHRLESAFLPEQADPPA